MELDAIICIMGILFHLIPHILVNQEFTDGREEEEEPTLPREKQKGRKGH